jgi:quercetin dioxygenase-like cupin family protein
MLTSRNAHIDAKRVHAVEGRPLYGGEMLVKPLLAGTQMALLEIHYAAGVGAPVHTHAHESLVYVVKGRIKSTVDGQEFIMGPGDACRHPPLVAHGLHALEDAVVVEVKAPAPDLGALFQVHA